MVKLPDHIQKEIDKTNRKMQDEITREFVALLIKDLKHIQKCPACMKRMQFINRCQQKEREKKKK